MGQLQIFLFGKFDVRCVGQELKDLKASKAQELLAYLLLHPTNVCHRETLATILWEDLSSTQSKKYFRRTLWQLQSALSAWSPSTKLPTLIIDGDWLQFNPQTSTWVDTIYLEQAYRRTRDVPGQHLDAEAVKELKKAVKLYRGELLSGWYQEWCLFERERLQQIYLDILDKLMLYFEANGSFAAGIAYGMQILRHDKAREHTHRRLMRLFCESGNRTEALRQYEQCAAILEKELGVRPAISTELLYQQIQKVPQSVALAVAPSRKDMASQTHSLLQKMHDELRQIQGHLTKIQHQVQHQIEAVESVLRK